MPIVIDRNIPAYSVLKNERIFVIDRERAVTQDIRPIEIALLNLMPTKKETETQFMRLLSNSPLQVKITLLNTQTYQSKNTEAEYLDRFYRSFREVKNKRFDGMIVTGAPLEELPYSEVKYWKELTEIFEFTATNVTSTIFICWGALAALHYFYGIEKYPLKKKLFGVFPQQRKFYEEQDELMRGISDEFHMCHSRHSNVRTEDVASCAALKILAQSPDTGVSIASTYPHDKIFVLGHMEYDRDTLKKEYERDLNKGLPIQKPLHYFGKEDNILMNWASTANLFYNNWLNFVYQTTPYRLD